MKLGQLLLQGAIILSPGLCLAQSTASPIVPRDRPDQGRPAQAATQPPSRPTAPARRPAIRPFVLREILVEGSSLPPETLREATQGLIGRSLDQDGLSRAADALAAAYARSDIALYTIVVPEQSFAGGSLRLIAVEGFVDSVEIAGLPSGRDIGLLRAYADKLQAERPLRRATLERYLSLMRDTPGLAPKISLLEGASEGAARLKVEADPRRFRGAMSINNRGTLFLGRTQAQLEGNVYSGLRQGDHTRLTVAFPTDIARFQYVALSHATPIGGDGASVQLSAGYLRTRPAIIPLRGQATSLGITVNHPVIRRYDRSLYLSLGLDGINSNNAFLGQTFSDERTRAVRALATYGWTGGRYALNVNGGASVGLDAFGASVASNGLSEVRFSKVNSRFSHDYQATPSVSIRTRAAAQYSSNRLPASEQFALGGEVFGRAYESAFVTGDSGYAGSVEVALRPGGQGKKVNGEVYGFADRGRVTYNPRLGQGRIRRDVASVGGGGRLRIQDRVEVGVEAAKGLENPLPFVDRKETRVVFGVRTVF